RSSIGSGSEVGPPSATPSATASPIHIDTAATSGSDTRERQTPRAHLPFAELPIEIPKAASSFDADVVQYGVGKRKVLYKRQLADVEFQLAQEDTMDSPSADSSGQNAAEILRQAMDGGREASDLVKGVYEGGLKTWECSIDLINYLTETYDDEGLVDLDVLEIGCGSALPSLHILKAQHEVAAAAAGSGRQIGRVHMQDYNHEVLRLVTLSNVLLNTVLNPSLVEGDGTVATVDIDELRGRELQAVGQLSSSPVTEDGDGVLELSDQDIENADRLLREKLIAAGDGDMPRIALYSGDWSRVSEELERRGYKYDLVVTSETIYDEDSYEGLYKLVRSALRKEQPRERTVFEPRALVAAKTIYFGLTGSTLTFKKWVEERGEMRVQTVWQSSDSMGREILELRWL
ncbi:hypothetical protein EV182_003181, partial [Spiromyces aspiralis]